MAEQRARRTRVRRVATAGFLAIPVGLVLLVVDAWVTPELSPSWISFVGAALCVAGVGVWDNFRRQ